MGAFRGALVAHWLSVHALSVLSVDSVFAHFPLETPGSGDTVDDDIPVLNFSLYKKNQLTPLRTVHSHQSSNPCCEFLFTDVGFLGMELLHPLSINRIHINNA